MEVLISSLPYLPPQESRLTTVTFTPLTHLEGPADALQLRVPPQLLPHQTELEGQGLPHPAHVLHPGVPRLIHPRQASPLRL